LLIRVHSRPFAVSNLIPLAAGGWLLCGCQSAIRSARQFANAPPAAVSPFLAHRTDLRLNPPDRAFHYEWLNTNRKIHRRALPIRQLYVAPVSLRYLRPRRASVAPWDQRRRIETAADAPELARRLHDEVVRAFQESPQARFRIVSRPSRDTLTLSLALVELTPTHVGANATKFAAKLFFGPIASVAGLAAPTGGTVAIEGRVTLSATGQPLYEFADQERDKLTFLSLRDFIPYGHAVIAIEEWARELEEISRAGPGQVVEDSTFWSLSPL
jgi:Protein of unknown function (DUF3313)